ncbi:DUF6132 family protein [Moheibacter lacus]|uniref:YtxH domain-containing protein n=1 Tax=Moheibacter lacus TaxID=2745851 RepID=A0A838ZJN8_9FLAO|nr:DUF6132 family protein [Moheibacter lacus]MBA5629851.1 hypothetical protein [Moheibacter lacus]
MKNFVVKHKLTLIGIALGAIGGFFYWQQIGCDSGSCAITSNPLNSTVYGSVMGGLFLSIFKKNSK